MKVEVKKPFSMGGKKYNVGDIVEMDLEQIEKLEWYELVERIDDFTEMPFKDLVAFAKKHGINTTGKKKNELIKELQEVLSQTEQLGEVKQDGDKG